MRITVYVEHVPFVNRTRQNFYHGVILTSTENAARAAELSLISYRQLQTEQTARADDKRASASSVMATAVA